MTERDGRPAGGPAERATDAGRLLPLDVALLLPPAAAAAVAKLNARLQPPPVGFAFDETHLPHVTLVQQFVRETDLPAVLQRLDRRAARTAPLALRGAGWQAGGTTTSLVVAGSAALADLHARLLDDLAPHAAGPGGAAAFEDGGGAEPARDRDVDWVRHFRAHAAGPRFEPHVTLGVGRLDEAALDGPVRRLAFTAVELAACQMGRFCTCRRVLRAWRLDAAGTPRIR